MDGRKLIEIKKAHPVRNNISNGARKVIFVGDTHGDLDASQKVIKDYLKEGNKIVFLGDYVDRGPFSRENIDYLLKIKEKYPDQIYLLQGNHEGHHILKFYPAEFWESLNETDYEKYCSIVGKFPLVVITKDIIALHGALPDLTSPGLVEKIKVGSEEWRQITWGDFSEESGEYLGIDPLTGRPQFGRDYFLKMMDRFGKKPSTRAKLGAGLVPHRNKVSGAGVLIRSHQPTSTLFMFDNRCLTIFTSSAYTRERTIAIADLKREIKTAKDLEIKRI